MESYKRLRPKTLSEIVGQQNTVKTIQGFLDTGTVPQAVLFFGPSGNGKTSLARILADALGATSMGLIEINFASERGIDIVRELESSSRVKPMSGKVKVFILDEAHSMTPQAGQSLLKLLEDTPSGVYMMLCTSEPERIPRALMTRLTKLEVTALTNEEIYTVIRRADSRCPENVMKLIAEASSGSAREALVMLDQLAAAGYAKEAIEQFTQVLDGESPEYKNLVADIIFGGPGKWESVYTGIRACGESDLEKLRRGILGYAAAVMKTSGKADRMTRVILLFQEPFFRSGVPGFLAAAYRSINLK